MGEIRQRVKSDTLSLNRPRLPPGADPYGATGTGAIACVHPLACIANAIYNATRVRTTNKPPLSPENVLGAPKEAGRA